MNPPRAEANRTDANATAAEESMGFFWRMIYFPYNCFLSVTAFVLDIWNNPVGYAFSATKILLTNRVVMSLWDSRPKVVVRRGGLIVDRRDLMGDPLEHCLVWLLLELSTSDEFGQVLLLLCILSSARVCKTLWSVWVRSYDRKIRRAYERDPTHKFYIDFK